MKKGSIIVIILVIVAIIAAGGFVSIKLLKERSGQETGEKNFIETTKEYLEEKLWKKSGIEKESLLEKSKEEIVKKTVINACKQQSEIKNKNACFTGLAVYYKDPSFCEYINIEEDRSICQKNIEDYKKAIKERDEELAKLSPEEKEQLAEYQDSLKQISEKMSNMSEEQIKNMSAEEYVRYMEQIYQEIIPNSNLETTPTSGGSGMGGGGGVTDDIYRITEERAKEMEPYVKEAEALSDDVKVEFTALLHYATYFYETEGMWSENAKEVMERVNRIEDENNISEEASQIIAVAVADDPVLQSRVDERYNELLKQGL